MEETIANVTCVAVGDRALMIEGPPGSGKSSLALALIDRGAKLIGDDGVRLQLRDGRCWAMPPPNIAGKLEIRGVGIVDLPTTQAPLALVLTLATAAERVPQPRMAEWIGISVPALDFRAGDPAQALRAEYALELHGCR